MLVKTCHAPVVPGVLSPIVYSMVWPKALLRSIATKSLSRIAITNTGAE